jgi:hypothetical protein
MRRLILEDGTITQGLAVTSPVPYGGQKIGPVGRITGLRDAMGRRRP